MKAFLSILFPVASLVLAILIAGEIVTDLTQQHAKIMPPAWSVRGGLCRSTKKPYSSLTPATVTAILLHRKASLTPAPWITRRRP